MTTSGFNTHSLAIRFPYRQHLRSRITWKTITIKNLSHSNLDFVPKHSTETALVKITKDLFHWADAGLLSIILLALSVTFNPISHQILVDRLTTIGVGGTVYQWFVHYLADRMQFVQIQNYRSENSIVHHGVPQGSVLMMHSFVYPLAILTV